MRVSACLPVRGRMGAASWRSSGGALPRAGRPVCFTMKVWLA